MSRHLDPDTTSGFFRSAIEVPATGTISVTLSRPDATALATHLEDVVRFREQSGADEDSALPLLLKDVRAALGHEDAVVSVDLSQQTLKALFPATNAVPAYVSTSDGRYLPFESRIDTTLRERMARGTHDIWDRFADHPWGRGPINVRHIEQHPRLLFFFWLIVVEHTADGDLTPVIDWVRHYLHLDKPTAWRWLRMQWLLRKPMPGVRSGGQQGMTDKRLGSRYAQLLLQTLQAMERVQAYDLALVRAARRSGLPLLVDAANALTPHEEGCT